MRVFALALTTCLATPLLLLAQGQAAPLQTPPAQASSELDMVLGGWEKAMSSLDSLVAQCTRTEINKVYQAKDIYEGSAKYLRTKQGSLASLEMKKHNRPEVFERYLCTGTYFYQFVPQQKEVRVHDMPKPKQGQVADNNFLQFLFGMKAVEAKLRYEMTFVPPPANDQWYYYIDIRPRTAADKVDFTRARLVLLRSNFMPRQLWFEEPNGNEIIWDFPRITANQEISLQEFAPPQLPEGWRYVRVPSNQPRVYRNQE